MSVLPVSAYERAERLLGHNRHRLALRASVSPRWLEDGACFTYAVETEQGTEHVFVDPAASVRRPARDDEVVADEDAGAILEIPSPDGRWVAFRRGEDVWVRCVEGGEERRLTDDGGPDRSYAAAPDALDYRHLMRRLGVAELPPALAWSPDSRRILTHRLDQSGLGELFLVESMPADESRPKLDAFPSALPGEGVEAKAEWVVLDLDGGVVVADAEPFGLPLMSPVTAGWAWWSEDSATVHYLQSTPDFKTLSLHRLDSRSGAVAALLEESGETRVEPSQEYGRPPLVHVLGDGSEALWYSQRDGWGHLYLYDLERGELRRQLTAGELVVQRILDVDETARVAHLVVSGLVEADPYLRSLLRVPLDGGEPEALDDDELDHDLVASPDGRWFLDTASTVAQPPVISVRDRDAGGAVALELERADVSRLLEAGWTPPERVRALADDGVTPVYGVLYKPFGFDPQERYAVVDHPYPGPQIKRVSPGFDQPLFGCDAEAVAALGFAVLALDGRGTPGRDKAFHDHSYRNFGSGGALEDHVAALRELAASRPWLDLDRVGIFGRSAGGVATARALLTYPDFYKVGVAEAGNHDSRLYISAWTALYDGPFEPAAVPRISNIELANRLEGKLLLIHGELDDNVVPQMALRLVDRLIAANKDFDLLIVPGAEHGFLGYDHYVTRRRWDFLVRHLMGAEPPPYRLAEFPIGPATRESIVAMQRAG